MLPLVYSVTFLLPPNTVHWSCSVLDMKPLTGDWPGIGALGLGVRSTLAKLSLLLVK